jgi:hypothetical protein
MTTTRLDDFSDSAWLIIAAVTVVLLVERILRTLEALMRASKAEAGAGIRVTHAAIMVLVGITAATIALPGEWVRSIVSALFVGVGFALKDIMSELLYGIQLSTHLGGESVQCKMFSPSDNKTMSVALKSKGLLCAQVVHESTTYLVPWSCIHRYWLSITPRERQEGSVRAQ